MGNESYCADAKHKDLKIEELMKEVDQCRGNLIMAVDRLRKIQVEYTGEEPPTKVTECLPRPAHCNGRIGEIYEMIDEMNGAIDKINTTLDLM